MQAMKIMQHVKNKTSLQRTDAQEQEFCPHFIANISCSICNLFNQHNIYYANNLFEFTKFN